MEEEEKKMSKKEFWLRFVLWFAFAVVGPLVYIACSYGFFVPSASLRVSGWGIIAIVTTCVCLLYVIHEAKKGMPRGSFAKQCIDGYTALLPMFFAILLIHVTKDAIAEFERFLIFTILCEAVAVPINPMPKWGSQYEEEKQERTLFNALSRAFKEKDK